MASSKSFCNPCSRNGTTSIAVKVCSDCDEGLCGDCLKAHSLFKAFASHQLKEVYSASGETFLFNTICIKHSGMALDLFCTDHDCILCRSCINDTHHSCQSLIPIDEASRGVKTSPMFEDVSRGFSNISKTLDQVTDYCNNNMKYLGDDEATILEVVSDVKVKIIKRLDEMEQTIKSEIKTLKQKYKSQIESDKMTISQITKSVNEISDKLNFVSENGTENQLFLLSNTLKTELTKYDTRIQKIIPSLETSRIILKEPELEDKLQLLGSVSVEVKPCDVKFMASKTNQAQVLSDIHQEVRKFKLDRKIKIESLYGVHMTSVAVTADNHLLLCNGNSRTLLEYSESGEPLRHCPLSGYPCDVAIMPRTSEAVVSFWSDTLQFIDTKTMTAGRVIKLSDIGYGCVVIDDKIYVGGYNKIYILDKEGQEISSIGVHDILHFKYLQPGSNSSIYFTSCDNNRAGCVDLEGNFRFAYSSENFLYPVAVTTDRRGNMYIASRDSSNIHRLSSDGELLDIILDNKDQIYKPYGIAFNSSYNKLFVTNNHGEEILVFSCE